MSLSYTPVAAVVRRRRSNFLTVRQMCFDGLRSVNDFVGGIKYSRYDTPVANDQLMV